MLYLYTCTLRPFLLSPLDLRITFTCILSCKVRKREKEKNDVVKEKGKQDDRIQELQTAKEKVSKLLKEEQTKVSAHLKTLKYYESQQKALDQERQEYRKVKQKLVTLQSMEVLLNGLL